MFVVPCFLILSPAARSQWMVSAYLGQAFTRPSDLDIKQPFRNYDLTFHKIHYTSRSFESPHYYGVRIAYLFSQSAPFGIEEEFIHAKVYSDPNEVVRLTGVLGGVPVDASARLGNVVQEFSVSHGLNFLFTNLVGGFRLFDESRILFSPMNIVFRVGVGPTIPHTESTVDGVHTEQYEFKGPAYQIAGGFQGYLFWRLNFLLEYKFTYTKLKDVTIDRGAASAVVRTHHVVFGLVAAL
jgi:hypothetical protein